MKSEKTEIKSSGRKRKREIKQSRRIDGSWDLISEDDKDSEVYETEEKESDDDFNSEEDLKNSDDGEESDYDPQIGNEDLFEDETDGLGLGTSDDDRIGRIQEGGGRVERLKMHFPKEKAYKWSTRRSVNDVPVFAQQTVGRNEYRKKTINDRKMEAEAKRVEVERGRNVGFEVRKRRSVLAYAKQELSKQPKVVCRLDAFSRVLNTFDASRMEVVKDMGFGDLLGLTVKNLPHQFCYWLISCVDAMNSLMKFGDGNSLPLGASQWKCIFGLPNGGEAVPTSVFDGDEYMEKLAEEIYEVFGDSKGGLSISKASKAAIPREDVNGEVIPVESEEEKLGFRTAFLILFLGQVLCPTGNGSSLDSALIPAVTAGAQCQLYDWCGFAHERLMQSALLFSEQFSRQGYATDVGGCTLFLMIFYLDHLDRPPLRWGVKPRICVWTDTLVYEVVDMDRRSTGDFGFHRSSNVLYSHMHPRICRDARRAVEDVTVSTVASGLRPFVHDSLGEAVSQCKKLGKIVEIDSSALINSSTEVKEGKLGMHHNSAELIGDDVIGEVNGKKEEENNGVGDQGDKRGVTPVATAVDGAKDGGSNKLIGHREVYEKQLVEFVRGWGRNRSRGDRRKASTSTGPIMMDCSGLYASQRACHDVLKMTGQVSNEYVRVVAAMYNKGWYNKHGDQSMVMFPPDFATKVMEHTDSYRDIGRRYGYCVRGVPLSVVNLVFVPVVDRNHWWCAVFDMGERKIFVIDTLFDNPISEHNSILKSLENAVDECLNNHDETWAKGTIPSWDSYVAVEMGEPKDNHSCRVLMLLCVKKFAEDLESRPTSFRVESISTAREQLLIEDVLSEFNEADVASILNGA